MRAETGEMGKAAPRTDGRAARAERTRDAIVAAMLALIEEGELHPTGPRIAERAGVSLRSVYQHFDDLEALFRRAAELHGARMAALERPLPLRGPLADRVTAYASERVRRNEANAAVRRAAALVAAASPEIAGRLQAARRRLRAEAEAVFTPELARLSAIERSELLDLLCALSDWPFWESLRTEQGLSLERAEAALARALLALLRPCPSGGPTP